MVLDQVGNTVRSMNQEIQNIRESMEIQVKIVGENNFLKSVIGRANSRKSQKCLESRDIYSRSLIETCAFILR